MKKLLICFMLIAITLLSFAKTLEDTEVIFQEGMIYEEDSEVPFTGEVIYKFNEDSLVDALYSMDSGMKFLSGQVYKREKYQRGVLDGKSELYYPGGRLKEVVTFRNGEREGTTYVYNPDGTSLTISYLNNEEVGRRVLRDAANNILGKLSFEDNILNGDSTFYYIGGQIKEEATFKDGLIEGINTAYYIDGNIAGIVSYKKGVLSGEAVFYHENGSVKSTTN